jgi:hypothetical protein
LAVSAIARTAPAASPRVDARTNIRGRELRVADPAVGFVDKQQPRPQLLQSDTSAGTPAKSPFELFGRCRLHVDACATRASRTLSPWTSTRRVGPVSSDTCSVRAKQVPARDRSALSEVVDLDIAISRPRPLLLSPTSTSSVPLECVINGRMNETRSIDSCGFHIAL